MGDEMVELREQVQAQQALIEQQAGMIEQQAGMMEKQGATIERLEERLAAVEHRETPAAGSPGGDDEGLVVGDRTTDRRHLLSKAATVAAGAVVGGTALALGQGSPAAAAPGIFTGNPAVNGTANPTTGTGVYGYSYSGQGVYGIANYGYGVQGYSNDGYGISGATAGGAQLLLEGTPPPPPTSAVNRSAGSVVRDQNNDLWLCIAGGTPGVWRRVSGANTAGALTLLAAPVRVYDSRANFPPAVGTKAKLVGGVARSCDLTANSSGVPPGATAVLVNLVATGTTGADGGFLAVYRNGIAWPNTSNLNWSGPGQNVAVTTLTAVDAAAVCNLYANVATDVVVDVIGYYL